jgi:hypothetical protein
MALTPSDPPGGALIIGGTGRAGEGSGSFLENRTKKLL